MTNQIVLGTIHNGKLCSIHRAGFPIKYWPDGYDGYVDAGWYWFDPEGGEYADEGFTLCEFQDSPFNYPMISAYDQEYGSVVLLVVVPGYEVKEPEYRADVGPANPERLFRYVREGLKELA